MRAAEGVERGTAGELERREGRPAPQDVAEDWGVLLLEPLQPLRESVLAGNRQTVGNPDCGTDHATAMCDERASARSVGRWGVSGCRVSRGVRSHASWRAASV